MMNKSIKNALDNRLESLTISDDLQEKIFADKPTSSKRVSRHFVTAAAVFLCLIISIPILAATIPSFKNLLAIVSPQVAEKLQPIEQSCVYDGIKMEAVASMNDDQTVTIYLTLQDLIADRIGESIDLYSYNITGLNTFTSELVNYDQSTKTATIKMLGAGGENMDGKNIEMGVASFLVGRQTFADFDTGIDLATLTALPQLNTFNMRPDIPRDVPEGNMRRVTGGSGEMYSDWHQNTSMEILMTDATEIPLQGINFAYISNIGYINDKLHIQVKWTKKGKDKLSIDDHGTFTLQNESGEEIFPSHVGFIENGVYYDEFVYNISQKQGKDYRLIAKYFTTNANFIEGDWKVKFKVQSVENAK